MSQNDQLLFEFLQPEISKPAAKQASPESPAYQNENAVTGSQPSIPPSPQIPSPVATAGEQPGDPTTFSVPPGESAAFRFSAQPRRRPLI